MRFPLVVQLTPEAQSAIASAVSRGRQLLLVVKAKSHAVGSALVAPVEIPVLEINSPPSSVPVEIQPGL